MPLCLLMTTDAISQRDNLERDLHNHSQGAEAIFQRMDKNTSKLETRINHCRSETKRMEGQWQKQQVMIQDLMTKLEALEVRYCISCLFS